MAELTCLMTTFHEATDVLKEAINSILNQTYKDFQFLIIVDDPDNNDIIHLLSYYTRTDERVRFVVNSENLGLPLALDRGIELIDTKYLARMDADDIALPNRFERQIEYLKSHPDTDIVGTYVEVFSNTGDAKVARMRRPCKTQHINACMKYFNVFAHPSLMGKTDTFKAVMYRPLRYSQDYDFMCRSILRGYIAENIPETLLRHRADENMSEKKIVLQRVAFCAVQRHYARGDLNEVDIVDTVDNEFKKVDIHRVAKSITSLNNAQRGIRGRQYASSVSQFLYAVLSSKYQRVYFKDLIAFCVLKHRFQF